MSARTTKDDTAIAIAKELNNVPLCEEYEKMVSGMLYNALDPDLWAARHRARHLMHEFNHFDPRTTDYKSHFGVRTEQLSRMFGKIGKDVFMESPLTLDYGCNTILGDGVYANFNLTILDTALVTIGKSVFFGPNVVLCTAGHETSVLSRIKMVEFGLPITIGDHAWIGANVTVLPGVTIGKGATIGAGAVVRGDIPEYSVAVGVPARVVKKLPTLEEEMADENNPFRNLPGVTLPNV